MKRIRLRRVAFVLRARNIQIHHNRLLSAAHHHRLHRHIRSRIQLLMRHKRRHVNKISRPRFVNKLQIVAPAKAARVRSQCKSPSRVPRDDAAPSSRADERSQSRPKVSAPPPAQTKSPPPASSRSSAACSHPVPRCEQSESRASSSQLSRSCPIPLARPTL